MTGFVGMTDPADWPAFWNQYNNMSSIVFTTGLYKNKKVVTLLYSFLFVKACFMSLLHQMNEWSSKHHPQWLVVLRVALGMSLLLKGFGFIQNSVVLSGYIAQTTFIQNASWLIYVIPWVHLLGGSTIIMGLFTRAATLIQIPILVGAVFFVNARHGILAGGSDLMFSIIVLLLLIFFFVEGSGYFSLDHYFFSNMNDERKGESV